MNPSFDIPSIAAEIARKLHRDLRAGRITKIDGALVEALCALIECSPSDRRRLINRTFREVVEQS
jgi:DNA-binding Xre family transcriptional regulator